MSIGSYQLGQLFSYGGPPVNYQPGQTLNYGNNFNAPANAMTIQSPSQTIYQLGQELGRGTFGVTYLGYDTRNNRNVAVKTIDIAKSEQMGANLASIDEEIATLKDIAGVNCSRYMACYYESFQGELNGVPTVFIISEYVNGSSLTKFIQENNGAIAPTVLWALYLQLLLGLKYIHDQGYAHRDIKPDNILLTDDYTIKYIDFGLACLQQCLRAACNNTCRGTPGTVYYMPPEFFNNTRVDSLDSSKAHDVWSLAIVMFEMANGLNVYPFEVFTPGRTAVLPNEQVMANIARAPEFSSNYAYDDGRTNIYLSFLLINNWHQRPKVDFALATMIENVSARVWACS